MIGYVTLGTNDLTKAAKFFDELFASIGVDRFLESDTFVAWGDGVKPGIAATKPFNGEKATVGNGTMVALEFDSPEKVDVFYAKAISLGATCEGPAGKREDGFYAGYFRDLDGNKFNAFYMVLPEKN